MKIDQISVKNNRRFKLNPDLKKFTFTPELVNSIIIGRNSCGKSSLMLLLTPYPCEHKDLLPNGYVEVLITHRNNRYKLAVRKDNLNKVTYDFIVNGEELNSNNMLSVQKELVMDHFKIDKEIHELLTSQIEFTTMSPLTRRKWFVRLSDTDYDYVLDVYSKIQNKSKSLKAIITHTSKKLVDEQMSLKDIDVDEVKGRIDKLTNNISGLIKHKTTVEGIPVLQERLKNHLTQLRSSYVLMMRSKRNLNKMILEDDLSEHELINTTDLLNKARLDYSSCKGGYDSVLSKMQELQSGMPVNKDNLPDLKSIKLSEDKLHFKLGKLPNGIQHPNPKAALTELEFILSNLEEVSYNLKPNKGEFNDDNLERLHNGVSGLMRSVEQLEGELSEYSNRRSSLRHLKTHDLKTCPKCQHEWYDNYDEGEYIRVVTKMKTLSTQVKEIRDTLAIKESELESVSTGVSFTQMYSSALSNVKHLDMLKDELKANNVLTDNPESIGFIAGAFLIKLKADIDREDIQDELKEIRHVKSLHAAIDKTDQDRLNLTISGHEKELLVLSDKLNRHKMSISKYERVKRRKAEMEKGYRGIENDSILVRNSKINLEEAIKQDAISISIYDINLSLSSENKLLNDITVNTTMVNQLIKEVDVLTKEKAIVDNLLSELSPVNGLIANSILGFITTFMDNLTRYMNKIWSYPLEMVVPKPSEEGGLDLSYRFALLIDNDQEVEDASKGSSSIQEIVNLAYKLTVMNRLGFDNYPVYLDEFAHSFDPGHRISAYKYLKEQLSGLDYSNIFIINHYPELYSIFDQENTQFTVLDINNVDTTVLPTFNDALET